MDTILAIAKMIASDPDGCKGVTINGPKGRSLEAALPKDPQAGALR